MCERRFEIVVIRERHRPLAYPPMNGERSLRCMQVLAGRGLATLALTEANGIQEELTLADMTAIYSDNERMERQ